MVTVNVGKSVMLPGDGSLVTEPINAAECLVQLTMSRTENAGGKFCNKILKLDEIKRQEFTAASQDET